MSADSHQSPCLPSLDTPECLAAVQQLMADENRFWFGTSYKGVCPPNSYNSECNNADDAHLSIATRMRSSSDNSVDVIQQVLNVTYDVPAGWFTTEEILLTDMFMLSKPQCEIICGSPSTPGVKK